MAVPSPVAAFAGKSKPFMLLAAPPGTPESLKPPKAALLAATAASLGNPRYASIA